MTTYHHDYAAFDRVVLCGEDMLAHMGERIGRSLARAEITAPYDAKDSDGEHYRDDFSVEVGIGDYGKGLRAFGRLSNSNSAAVIVEYGNSKTPRHRTLGNALDAAGD